MSNKPLVCPVEVPNCEWLDEIVCLRKEILDLSELVSTDSLTGLYNFRHFKHVLQAEMDRSKRSGIPTSLVMVDIDHFKAVNDTYGHEVGNLALKQIADILKNEVRATDVVCRYGGEEFAIIFAETHLRLAVKVADRIRQTIASTPVIYDEGEFFITASMGASVYIKTSILEATEFVDSVDKYLYEAKQSGRNCICHIDYADLRAVTEVSVDERAMLFGNE
ncbi:MAG: diguanylate cyclase (GGDEF)-like protein [Gammaproteobacteria bacterium]|jgi:diguanylate cyclase (GGDEF)-like protein